MVEEDSSYLGEARGESDVSFCYRGEFKILRRRRQRKRQKSNRLNWRNNNSTCASRFFFPFLCRHCTTTTISRFIEDLNKRRLNILSLSELEYDSQEFGSERVCVHLTK